MMKSKKQKRDFDKLADCIASLSKTTVKELDPERYYQLVQAVIKIQNMLNQINTEWNMKIEIIDSFNLGSVLIELSEMTVINPHLFCEIISDCDNFEIYPLTNGKIRIAIAFQRVFRSV